MRFNTGKMGNFLHVFFFRINQEFRLSVFGINGTHLVFGEKDCTIRFLGPRLRHCAQIYAEILRHNRNDSALFGCRQKTRAAVSGLSVWRTVMTRPRGLWRVFKRH